MEDALYRIAMRASEDEWYNLLLDLGEKRFTANTFLTIHHKKKAFEAFRNDTPYSNIITKPQVCRRTIARYLKEFIMGFLTKA
jgi:hypothetical protein